MKKYGFLEWPIFATFGLKISPFVVLQEQVPLHLSKRKFEILDLGLPVDAPVHYRVPMLINNFALEGGFISKTPDILD